MTSYGVAGKDGQETDPGRILRLKECCDLLLAGGYHRARITALSPFDRVVGGLVWSITASNMDVDVDIIFQENSTIGQRIRLADSIISALVKMKCPTRIDPQEIQGLNYDRLFLVIQWLVRKVIETRELTGDLVRAQSVAQFGKHYSLPADRHPPEARAQVLRVTDRYRPARKYRARAGASFKSPSARTDATLLEFGERLFRADTGDDSAAPAAGAAAAEENDVSRKRAGLLAQLAPPAAPTAAEKRQKEEEERRARAAVEEKRVAALQEGLQGVGEGAGSISVGTFIPSDEITRFDEELRRQEAELVVDEEPTGRRALQQAFRRQREMLERQLAQQQAELEAARAEASAATGERERVREELDAKEAYNARVAEETAKLDETEKTHPKRAMLAQLKELVQLNESLKEQERQFKANCKAQMQELQELVAGLESGESDEETRRMLEVERIFEADLAKLNKLRAVLAAKNQEIARVQRAIDDVPTRAELIQYERRFVELYELVAEKLKETRKYYALYNTLEETHRYTQNEVSVLESINKTFPQALQSKAGTAHFLTSFKGIVDGVSQSVTSVRADLQNESELRDKLAERHKALLDKQRRYFKAVKEFEEECHRNELLSAKLAEAGQAKAAAGAAAPS